MPTNGNKLNSTNLIICRPVKTNWISQSYGESKACVSIYTGKIVNKVGDTCTSGHVDFYKSMGMLYHNGIDFVAYYKERVYHSMNFEGWMRTEMDNAGGIGVDIVSYEPILQCTEPNCNEKHYIKARYWHNTHITWWGAILLVTYGVKKYLTIKVKMGDNIALAGTTGKSSGVHVHYNPKWCDKEGNGIHLNNGTYGAFNPTPYFDNIFVLDYIKKEKVLIEPEIVVIKVTILEKLRELLMLILVQLLKAKKSIGSLFIKK